MSNPTPPAGPTPGTKEFEPVINLQEIYSFFAEGSKSLSSILIWVKNEEAVIHSHLVMISESEGSFYSWIPEKFDLPGFLEKIKTRDSNEFLFSLSLSRANIFFKSHFKSHDSAGLRFAIPNQVFKVQRRKNARLLFSPPRLLKVEYQDPLFETVTLTKKLYDISAGGLSFVTSTDDAVIYPTGLELKNVRFVMKAQQIVSDAEVRHIIQLPSPQVEKSIKVGVRFKNIKNHDTEIIASYVFDESRKQFSNLL